MSCQAVGLRSEELSRKLAAINRVPAMGTEELQSMLRDVAGFSGPEMILNPPFRCLVGRNLFFEGDALLNYNMYLYDALPITVGEHTLIGPCARIYSGCSPDRAPFGLVGDESKPVRIGRGCWFGGSVTILSGSTVGDRVVIGAGSVVCGDLPPDCVAVGRPARPVSWVNGATKPSA